MRVSNHSVKFSVLIPVYIRERADLLDRCLQSIRAQTRRPDEIIIVKDGPVTEVIEETIGSWSRELPIRSEALEKQHGLGVALDRGLKACSFDLVARMDADDVCRASRFETQVARFNESEDLAVLGSHIEEFDIETGTTIGVRTVPVDSSDISASAWKRNPFNHMTVMFRKSTILSVGGYRSVPGFEDYDLWLRVIQAGHAIGNVDAVLVDAGVGTGMVARRRGGTYAKKEVDFLKRQYDEGRFNWRQHAAAITMRLPVRYLPGGAVRIIYRLSRQFLFRTKGVR